MDNNHPDKYNITAQAAAKRLEIKPSTFYAWLRQQEDWLQGIDCIKVISGNRTSVYFSEVGVVGLENRLKSKKQSQELLRRVSTAQPVRLYKCDAEWIKKRYPRQAFSRVIAEIVREYREGSQ